MKPPARRTTQRRRWVFLCVAFTLFALVWIGLLKAGRMVSTPAPPSSPPPATATRTGSWFDGAAQLRRVVGGGGREGGLLPMNPMVSHAPAVRASARKRAAHAADFAASSAHLRSKGLTTPPTREEESQQREAASGRKSAASTGASPPTPTLPEATRTATAVETPDRVRALEACFTDGETQVRECVAPDLQFRTPWKVFLVSQDSPGSGWRFFHLVSQGYKAHPYIQRTSDLAEADAVLWLPISTGQPPPQLLHNSPSSSPSSSWLPLSVGAAAGKEGSKKQRVLVLDEGDGSGYYPPAQKVHYLAYFKRSWVAKKDGRYKGPARRLRNGHAYFPMPYSASDGYHGAAAAAAAGSGGHDNKGGVGGAAVETSFEGLEERQRPVVCSLRCHPAQPTRCLVLNWTKAAMLALDLPLAEEKQQKGRRRSGEYGKGLSVVGEFNGGHRKELNSQYFTTMREARIVVTCNPSHWEGDFRLFEAMTSGALVFVDEMWAPMPWPLVHLKHVVVYSFGNKDGKGDSDAGQKTFAANLKYYLEHPLEARAIAKAGLVHTLKYHRSVSRLDYFLRSAHDQELHEASLVDPAPPPTPSSPSVDSFEGGEPYQHTGRAVVGNYNMTMTIQPRPRNWKR